jgi:hypothetical protein
MVAILYLALFAGFVTRPFAVVGVILFFSGFFVGSYAKAATDSALLGTLALAAWWAGWSAVTAFVTAAVEKLKREAPTQLQLHRTTGS